MGLVWTLIKKKNRFYINKKFDSLHFSAIPISWGKPMAVKQLPMKIRSCFTIVSVRLKARMLWLLSFPISHNFECKLN